MLKVECESCKAPYQLDERRIPPTGLKMRCPRCGHAFLVKNPATVTALPRPAPSGGPPQRGGSKATFIGVPGANIPAMPPARSPFGDSLDDTSAKESFSSLPPALGSLDDPDLPLVAPPRAPAAPKFPPPTEPGFGLDIDLPVVSAGLPALKGPRPTSPASPAREAFDPGLDLDLPVVAPARRTKPFDHDEIADLPSPVPDLPAIAERKAKPFTAPLPPAPPIPGRSDEPDLPAYLPRGRASLDDRDLPAVATGLPAVAVALPALAPDLPSAYAGLPATSAGLPAVSPGLPAVSPGFPAPSPGFPAPSPGLPAVGPDFPAPFDTNRNVSQGSDPARRASPFDDFGELDLPVEPQVPAPAPHGGGGALGISDFPPPALGSAAPTQARGSASPAQAFNDDFGFDAAPKPAVSAPPLGGSRSTAQGLGPSGPAVSEGDGFGELDLDGFMKGVEAAPAGDAGMGAHTDDDAAGGGVGFGELDFGEFGGAAIGTEAPLPSGPPPPPDDSLSIGALQAGTPIGDSLDASFSPSSRKAREPRREALTSRFSLAGHGKKIFVLLGGLFFILGALLALTPVGMFGNLAIRDAVYAKDYVRATDSVLTKSRALLATDTLTSARQAIDEVTRTQTRWPRARPLEAYAAFVEYSAEVRFGAGTVQRPHATQWVAELTTLPDTRYYMMALGAQQAAKGEFDKAKATLERARSRESDKATLLDITLLLGEIELATKGYPAALATFTKALALGAPARAQFGIARAQYALGAYADAGKAVEATLAASPGHVGARIFQAMVQFQQEHVLVATLKTLDDVFGALKPGASTSDLARAHALKGWVMLARGAPSEARAAFDDALKADSRFADALIGLGEVLYAEGRYTEALSRFETAAQVDPSATESIVGQGKTLLKLERLSDAKARLVDGRKKLPKNGRIAYGLAIVENALGNKKEAEEQLRAAIALASTTDPDAVLPYVTLSTLLASQGRSTDAQKVLDDARKRLPDSAAMQRALGEVSASQGRYDDAIQHFMQALARDDKDLASRFSLASTLRKVRRFDEAKSQFDKLAEADKAYPGLALERGLLYEQSGDIQKALEEFKLALSKAPDDADLQLRVGAAYVGAKRPDEAMVLLRKVLRVRPSSAEAHHYVGRAWLLTPGGEPNAMNSLKRAVEIDPNRAEYHLYVGWAANDAATPQLGLARAEIDRALDLDKTLAEGYWLRGSVLRKVGAADDALVELRHALELKPSLYQVHATMAECFEAKSDFNGAMSEYAKALAIDDKQPRWQFRYGKLLFERGNCGDALKQLTSALSATEGHPQWIIAAEFMSGECHRKVGNKSEAGLHYLRFLQNAPTTSPDRDAALHALKELGIRPPQ